MERSVFPTVKLAGISGQNDRGRVMRKGKRDKSEEEKSGGREEKKRR